MTWKLYLWPDKSAIISSDEPLTDRAREATTKAYEDWRAKGPGAALLFDGGAVDVIPMTGELLHPNLGDTA